MDIPLNIYTSAVVRRACANDGNAQARHACRASVEVFMFVGHVAGQMVFLDALYI